MIAHSYLRSLSQIYCLRIDFALFVWVLITRTLLAKLCSVFKVLARLVQQTAFIFYQMPSFFVKNFFHLASPCDFRRPTTVKYITRLSAFRQLFYLVRLQLEIYFHLLPYVCVFLLFSYSISIFSLNRPFIAYFSSFFFKNFFEKIAKKYRTSP